MSFNPNMSNKEVADLLFLDYKTQKPYLNLDFANVTTTNLEASREYAKGGQGAPDRIAFDGQRKGTLEIESQIATMKLFSMLSGQDVAKTFKYAKKYELTAASGSITIPGEEVIVAGSVTVYKADDDCGTPVEAEVSGRTITLGGGSASSNDNFIVYAIVNVTKGQSVKFDSKTFPKAFTVYGTTPWKTEDDEIAEMHLTYYKAQPQSQFSLAFNNQGVIDIKITCDLMANKEGDIYDMSIEDED